MLYTAVPLDALHRADAGWAGSVGGWAVQVVMVVGSQVLSRSWLVRTLRDNSRRASWPVRCLHDGSMFKL